MEAKAALVLQGGGTRGAYTAGVLDVLLEKDFYFPYVIGTSAGALNGVDFVSRDVGRSKTIIIELMLDPKFASVHNLLHLGTFFDFDYLIHEVPKEKAHFDQKTFEESPVTFYVAATGMEDGKAHYFEKHASPDFWHGVAASASLPLLARPVMVEGHPYLDGGPAAAIPFKKPLEDGWKKMVVVTTRDKNYRKGEMNHQEKHWAHVLYRKYPKFLESFDSYNANYNADTDELFSLEEKGGAFVIAPSSPVTISHAEKDPEKLNALYDAGKKDAEDILPSLIAYLTQE